MRRPRSAVFGVVTALVLGAPYALAQQPPPPQQYPPQQYPPQQYPPQQYPPQQYPPQQYPPQQYPPQQYPPQQYPPQGPYGQPGYGQPAPPPPPSNRRSAGEMTFLYVTSALYGVGSGIWLDALFKIDDPATALILPIGLGAAVPVGMWLWDDQGGPMHRGVPASIATGLVLGGVEGIAISGVQWQYTREQDKDWTFQTQTTVTWIMATGGGVGGWAFGEWIRPDPRSMGFIAGTSAWGAISGTLFGTAISGKDWKDGASVVGLIGYNAGILGGGALSIIHTPSWRAQQYMWMGYGLGTLAGCLVFPAYLFVEGDAKRGFIGPALGGLAGAAIAGAFSYGLKDPEDTPRQASAWKPPFDVHVMSAPALTPPTLERTAARRSLETMLGPESSAASPMPGVVVNAVGQF
jgi:hypothetical protein